MDEKKNEGMFVWTLLYLTTIRCCFLLANLKQPTQPTAHMRGGVRARSDRHLPNKIWTQY
jgi:hypothetical protein